LSNSADAPSGPRVGNSGSRVADILDIAVVGGGIFACTLAHRAALAFPGCHIALFEQGMIGGGCSAAAGALATPAVRSERVRALSDDSRAWYADYRRDYPDAPMRELPILYVASERAIPTLTALLSPASTCNGRDRLPAWLLTSPADCTLAGPPAVWADVRALCGHLLSVRPGIRIYEGARIETYFRENNVWRLRLSDGRDFSAYGLVLAKGSWFDAAERAALAPLRNKKIVSFVIDLPTSSDDAAMYLYDDEAFLLPLPSRGCWLLSVVSTHWDCHPDRDYLQAAPSDLATAVCVLSRYAPTLLPALRGARTHCDGYLEGHLPRVSMIDGAICMYGGSGSGFRYAPGVAAAALDALERSVNSWGR
jgi:glycine/D-amino acid oxidase-like deaminating enzyme